MKTVNIEKCPCCGQSVNEREISLYEGMVDALANVFAWCKEKNRWEDIRFKEFNHLLGPSEMARFSDWRFFAPHLISGANGSYTFDEKGIAAYLANETTVNTRILNNPLTKERKFFDPKKAREVAPAYAFMDAGEYVATYGGTSEKNLVLHTPSHTRPFLYHSLRRRPDGPLWCTCEGFRYRNTCKHVTEQEAQEQAATLFS